MPHYAVLDVSNEETAIHVVDETDATVWRGKRASDPEVLATALRRHAPQLVPVDLETGPLTP
jgi:transposase